jgi:hypothetical protein
MCKNEDESANEAHDLAGEIVKVTWAAEVQTEAARNVATCRARGLLSDWDEDACQKVPHFAALMIAVRRLIPSGGTAETGVYRGGTSALMMLGSEPDRFHVSVDPFGLPGQAYADPSHGYGNWAEARRTVLELSKLAHEQRINFCHYWMASVQFVGANLLSQPGGFRAVHLDGPHDVDTVTQELRYFRSRIDGPCVFILDDHDDHFPGVQQGLEAAGQGLVPIFHRIYETRYGRCGFSAWLHWSKRGR